MLRLLLIWMTVLYTTEFAVCYSVRAEEPLKHITVPFKKVKALPWSEDGTSFQLDIIDEKLGALTLTLRIQDVTSGGYTLAADGTDFAMGYPLPPEENASGLYRFLLKKLEPQKPQPDSKVRECFKILLQAGYFTWAEKFLQEVPVKSELQEALRSELRTARTEETVRITRTLIQRGELEEAGRYLTNWLTREKPTTDEERQAAALKSELAAETKVRNKWNDKVNQIKEVLKDARGDEAAWIPALLADLNSPLTPPEREKILESLRANTTQAPSYSQALDLLREFSFASRYGMLLKRSEIPSLEDFFAVESAINRYIDAPDSLANERLEAALAAKLVTDRVFEFLVRNGKRIKALEAQDVYSLRAPTDELEVRAEYKVLLPATYHPSKPAPLLIVLHGLKETARNALAAWSPEALKRGWIVCAPELPIGREGGYRNTPEERAMVLKILRDCEEHFSVETSRVYLGGHSMGGFMAWDLALTYPDLFAGAASLGGTPSGLSAYYVENALSVPIFSRWGEYNLKVANTNRTVREELQKFKAPYNGKEIPKRGVDSFLDEIKPAIEWMEYLKRERVPTTINFVSNDQETTQCGWLAFLNAKVETLRAAPDPVQNLAWAMRTDLAGLTGTIKPDNVIEVKTRKVQGFRIYVPAENIDLQKPLKIIVNGRAPVSVPLEPSRKTLLKLVRQSGDRERLYWCAIDVPVK